MRTVLLVLALWSAACVPMVRLPSAERREPTPRESVRPEPAPPAVNPGKVVLITVGVVCVLLVLALVVEGPGY